MNSLNEVTPMSTSRSISASVERFTSTLALFFYVVSTIVATSVALSLSRHLTVGLRELKKGASLFGSMQLDHRIGLSIEDEFGELATSFNDMAANLRAAGSQLEQSNFELRRSEEQYRSLFENAVYGIFRSDGEGRFRDVNPALVAMLGYREAAEVIRLDLAGDVFDEPESYHGIFHGLPVDGRVESAEAKWNRKDGSSIMVRLSGRVIQQTGSGSPEFEIIAEDITEKRTLEDQLRQSQKMEAVGQLAGGVAHDFNNLLTIIHGHSELLLKSLDQDAAARKNVGEIVEAADRATSLTRQLLAFGRRQMLRTQVLDLNTLVIDMGKMLRRLIGEHIEFTIRTGAARAHVRADQSQIEQVILNLVVNARDAMPKGGQLRIETANAELDESYVRRHGGDLPAGRYAVLAVSDTGMGMDPKTQARIFEPFFTTKELGKGTGLGLATVYGIVKQSDGRILVYSGPAKGSTFIVYLPLVAEIVEAEEPSKELGAPARGSETVLVVEDQELIRELARESLQRAGYKVLEAGAGNAALQVVKNHRGPIHLLLTDVVMPKMGGHDLAQQVSMLHPEISVLYISGYAESVAVHKVFQEQSAGFLQKPFSMDSLVRNVREILDKAQTT
jgi:PAS domain S-box-containing protein